MGIAGFGNAFPLLEKVVFGYKISSFFDTFPLKKSSLSSLEELNGFSRTDH